MSDRKKYSDAFRESALTLLSANNENQNATARQLGIPRKTLAYWSSEQPNKAFVSILPVHSIQSENADTFLKSLESGLTYKEKHLRDAIAQNCDMVFDALAIPRPISIATECIVSRGCRVDFLARHADGTYTIAEIKSCGGQKGRGWLLYSIIGQALYYLEVVSDVYGIDAKNIRLCLLLDYDPDEYFMKAIEHINCSFFVLNVTQLFNVSTSKIH